MINKLNDIIDYLISEQNLKLNIPTLRKIMKIDSDFDFNKFKLKNISITILYSRETLYDRELKKDIKVGDIEMKEMNTTNCFEEKVYDMIGFRLKGNNKIETDLNLFVKNIDDITSILQNRLIDWSNKTYIISEYQVKYLPSKKNIKTFRFVLHSYTKRAHNLQTQNTNWKKLYEFYINGNSIKEDMWLLYAREYKLSRILKE